MVKKEQGKKPQRTCTICRQKLPKVELFRFVWQDGGVVADKKQRLSGRGAYCCEGRCLQLFLQSRKKWKRLFRLN